MPKDTRHEKKKTPAPLFDNSTRGFLSTRTTSTIGGLNDSSRRYATHSQIIPALPKPLFGAFDETLYARPDDFSLDESDSMDKSNDEAIDSGLPGIAIKVHRRYRNSVRLSLLLHLVVTYLYCSGCAPCHLGRLSQRVLG